jgi:hypothetical protein
LCFCQLYQFNKTAVKKILPQHQLFDIYMSSKVHMFLVPISGVLAFFGRGGQAAKIPQPRGNWNVCAVLEHAVFV